MLTTEELRRFAAEAGTDVLAVTSAEPFTAFAQVLRERAAEYAAAEEWLKTRVAPTRAMAGARSIVLVGEYRNCRESAPGPDHPRPYGRIAREFCSAEAEEAWPRVAQFIRSRGCEVMPAQRHIPVKAAVVRSGAGRYGKNNLTYVDGLGSWVRWSPLLTDAELEPTGRADLKTPHPACEGCSRCIEACPTGALTEPYRIDPRRCRDSILGSEAKIPEEMRGKMGSWIYGCDVCQEVCPINKGLRPKDRRPSTYSSRTPRLPDGLDPHPMLISLLDLDDRHRVLKRNAIIALGNLGAGEAAPKLAQIAQDRSFPLARYAEWALRRIKVKM